MVGFNVKQFQGAFFTSSAVTKKVKPAARKVLSKFGSYVRQTARQSIKNKKRSVASQPPANRTGKLKRFIYFGYDTNKNSVIIGPAKLTNTVSDTALISLEEGGSTDILTHSFDKARGKHSVQRSRVFVAARPFMKPAFDKELPKVPSMWKDSIK